MLLLNTDSQEISVKINKKFSNSIQTRGIIHDMDRSVNNFVKFYHDFAGNLI